MDADFTRLLKQVGPPVLRIFHHNVGDNGRVTSGGLLFAKSNSSMMEQNEDPQPSPWPVAVVATVIGSLIPPMTVPYSISKNTFDPEENAYKGNRRKQANVAKPNRSLFPKTRSNPRTPLAKKGPPLVLHLPFILLRPGLQQLLAGIQSDRYSLQTTKLSNTNPPLNRQSRDLRAHFIVSVPPPSLVVTTNFPATMPSNASVINLLAVLFGLDAEWWTNARHPHSSFGGVISRR